ncbi:MAG: ABC transporter permease [Lachnospiraceae bacterium]|nr:ABC transporter permease [Lachnospiraceae bacterium]
MPFYRRGVLYLIRKPAKMVLLLLVFLLVNTMILGTNMILHATERTEVMMQEKTGTKVICEIADTSRLMTVREAEDIGRLSAVTSVNRMGQQEVFLADAVPVTGSNSVEPDNQKVRLLSYDDMEADGPFSDNIYRLISGTVIRPGMTRCAVINEGLAIANDLQIGDILSFETDEGKQATVEITGVYLAGNETRQEDDTVSVHRIENQIYIDNTSYQELSSDYGFYKLSVYTGQPDYLDTLAEKVHGVLQDKTEITTSDALYQQMKAPLGQITQAVELMRILTFLTGTIVVSLLLCMWMRSRQSEMAVFISMGERKACIFLQALLEAGAVFVAAIAGSCGVGMLAADQLENMLRASAVADVSLKVSLQPIDIIGLFLTGGAVVMIAVLLSLQPVLWAKPKDILSRMEG